MKNLGKNVKMMLLAGTILMAPHVMAQDGQKQKNKDPEARAQEKTEWMTKELSLSDEQSTKVKAIHLQHMQKMQSVKAMEEETQRKNAMMEVRKARETAIRSVLTPEQQTRMQEIKAERRAKKMEHKGSPDIKEKRSDHPKKEGMEKK